MPAKSRIVRECDYSPASAIFDVEGTIITSYITMSTTNISIGKMTIYNPNVDLINDNVHTKFC